MTTITTTLDTGITISPGGSYVSPLVVTGAGAVISTSGIAVYSTVSASVENFGKIEGAFAGIFLEADSALYNTGLLAGTDLGFAGLGYADVTNRGTISADLATLVTVSGNVFAGIGVDLLGGGNVSNQSGGVITGVEDGIGFFNNSATVVAVNNDGVITATGTVFIDAYGTGAATGIFLSDGGTVTNQSGGTIAAYGAGVQSFLDLGPAGEFTRNSDIAVSVDNAGLIEGGTVDDVFVNGTVYSSSGGVVLNGGGALTNEASGRISGHFGVYVNGGSSEITNTVDNLGTISGLTNFGVMLGENASLTNAGQVYGDFAGVYLMAGNRLANAAGGTITGHYTGVGAASGVGLAAYVSNGGSITGGRVGVALENGGTLNNANGGTISASLGVYFKAGGTVLNAGSISSAGAAIVGHQGVTENGAVDVQNSLTGYITAGAYAFYLQGGGSVSNAGIIGGGGAGILALQTAVISNASSGFIGATNATFAHNGVTYGGAAIALLGGGTVTNAGDIDGNGYTGVLVGLAGGGTVINSGQLTGVQYGVYAGLRGGDYDAPGQGVSDVTNSVTGTIAGKSGDGVDLAGGGSVQNAGLISGGSEGIRLDNLGSVTNSGTVLAYVVPFYTGDLHGGIRLSYGGVVNNSGLVESSRSGIVAVYGAASILNSGTIYGYGGTVAIQNRFLGDPTMVSEGVYLREGGYVSNSSGGLIAGRVAIDANSTAASALTVANAGRIFGTYYAIDASAAATVTNSGLIESTARHFVNPEGISTGGSGILLLDGGTVTNAAGGSIIGYSAIGDFGAPVSVVNAGYLKGEGFYSAVYMYVGGSVNNSGFITGQYVASVYAKNDAGTVTNSGLITGTGAESYGVYLKSGGLVTNTGTIAANEAVFIAESGVLGNTGSILGGTGVVFTGGGSISNSSAGVIRGTTATLILNGETYGGAGIDLFGGGTVTNAGGVIFGYAGGIGALDLNGGENGSTVFNAGTIESMGTNLITAGTVTFGALGVNLESGGLVDNEAGGTIIGAQEGVLIVSTLGVASSANNAGLIEATNSVIVVHGEDQDSAGVILYDGGTLTNQESGRILGAVGAYVGRVGSASGYIENLGLIVGSVATGVILGQTASLMNAGTVLGASVGVFLHGTDAMENVAGGTIAGGILGLYAGDTPGLAVSMQNSGSVYGAETGVLLNASTQLTNNVGGVIQGGGIGIDDIAASGLAVSMANFGTIMAPDSTFMADGHAYNDIGVAVSNGGTLDNEAGGTIVGHIGVLLGNNSTFINAGTVYSNYPSGLPPLGQFAVQIVGDGDRIIAEPGAVFNGLVEAESDNGILEFAAGTGTLNERYFWNFDAFTFDPGAAWLLQGALAEFTSGQVFSGFTSADTLEIFPADTSIEEDVATIGENGVLTIGASTGPYYITFSSTNAGQTVFLTGNTLGDEFITESALCFHAGTHLRTPYGERKVETLQIGDAVKTAAGASKNIKWIGHRSYDGRFIAGNHLMLPVCIKANAIAPNIPARDLFVSPGHGINLDGALIPAWRLINGISILQAEDVERVDYFHVELDEHDILLAENCPAESFYDAGLRGQFQNAVEFGALYPDGSDGAALPRVESGALLEAIRSRLANSATMQWPGGAGLLGYVDQAEAGIVTGWAWQPAEPDRPVWLDIRIGARRAARVLANQYRADLRKAGIGDGCHGFSARLPPGLAGRIEVRGADGAATLAFTEALAGRGGPVKATG